MNQSTALTQCSNIVKEKLDRLIDIDAIDDRLYYMKQSKLGLITVGHHLQIEKEIHTEVAGKRLDQNKKLMVSSKRIVVCGRDDKQQANYVLTYGLNLELLSQQPFILKEQSNFRSNRRAEDPADYSV